jgi:rhodanese-related sulfurtransferase
MALFHSAFSLQSTVLLAFLALVSVEGAGCSSNEKPKSSTGAMADQNGHVARDISDTELTAMMAQSTDLLLIDVRTDKEWDAGHIEGACLLDFLEDDFKRRAEALPKDRPIALYCAAGGRSEDAMKLLAKAGFHELYNLRNGFYGWEDAGRAVSNAAPLPLPTQD